MSARPQAAGAATGEPPDAPRGSRRGRSSIFRRVLATVAGAGLITLALGTVAVVRVVSEHLEAELVDESISTTIALREGLESEVLLARARLAAISLAAAQGELLEVPALASGGLTALRCRRGGEVLVEASSDEAASALLDALPSLRPDTVKVVGDELVALSVEAAGVTTTGLLRIERILRAPAGWQVRLEEAAGAAAGRSPAAAGGAPTGSVHARREVAADGVEYASVTAPSELGLQIVAQAPLTSAQEAALRVTQRIVLWSALALVPLVLLAFVFARHVTDPVRALARSVAAVREGAPLALPALRDDEVGDLAGAISRMTARLHDEARAQQVAVAFLRRVSRLRDPEQVYEALGRALADALPSARFVVVTDEELASVAPVASLDIDPAALRLGLEEARAHLGDSDPPPAGAVEAERAGGDATAADHARERGGDPDGIESRWRDEEESTGRGRGAVRGFRSEHLPARAVVIPIGDRVVDFGAVVGREVTTREAMALAELLTRAALSALRALQIGQVAVQNEKLAAMGRLSASVAHEMNNPLAFILTNLRALEETSTGEQKGIVTETRQGAERLAIIVRDLSSMSRREGRPTLEKAELGPLVRDAVKVGAPRHPEVPIDLQVEEGVSSLCSSGRIQQAALNLVVNALDAVAGKPDARVWVRVRRGGSRAVIEVEDNGPGIPPGAQRKIFEAFYTTKGEHGTGLGLFLSRSFVQGHGGDIELARTGAGGTTFVLWLPAFVGTISTRPRRAGGALGLAAGEGRPKVLLIDDEASILRSLARWLGKRADVVSTQEPEEALARLETEAFSLVLCDLHMPAMTGLDFLERLEARSPELAKRVVIMTGSTAELPEGVRTLRKPFDPEEIEALLAGA